MRFLLIHRWQGALLGCSMGGILTKQHKLNPYLQIGQQMLKSFVEKRQLAEQDWLNVYQQYQSDLKMSRSGDIILALFPLMLLYPDNMGDLKQQLGFAQDLWQQPSETFKDLFLWGQITSLILREQLQPQQWLNDLSQVVDPSLQDLLRLVEKLLKEKIPLHQGIKQLSRERTSNQFAIALSLYCFGSTPEDGHLSILRASQTQEQSELTTALTGFLSGLHNSISGFPLSWRLATQNEPTIQSIHQQLVQLFAIWSGHYEINAKEQLLTIPLTTSGIIQRRTSLDIISQKKF